MSHCFILLLIGFLFLNANSIGGCMETERQALLQFKQGLIDPGDRLASWVPDDRDCCRWAGVVCNNLTGHVLELHLRTPKCADDAYYPEYVDYMRSKLSGKINPSLLGLKYLSYLDLSNNDFQGISIPKFLGSLGSLRHINLSNALFGGEVPPQLGNLSNLQYLDLHHDTWHGGRRLYVKSLEWLSDLSLLEHLDLKSVSLENASNGLQYLNNLPSLVELSLSYSGFSQIHPLSHANLSSLAILDLSMNEIENSSVINWVFGLKNLVFLDLSSNGVQGPIPEGLQNMSSLKHLDLSGNNFNSSAPNWLYSFSPLEFLDLSGNNLEGQISSAIGNLTFALSIDLSWNDFDGEIPRSIGKLCNLRSIAFFDVGLNQEMSIILEIFAGCVSNTLESLNLGWCGIFGQLTNQLARFKKLTKLFLEGNSISGPIPPSMGELSSLKFLYLSDNKLKGNLPQSLGQLVNLELLDISKNFLEGVVSEIQFYNLSKLKIFLGSGNPLVLKVNSNWIPPFQIVILGLQSWVLGPAFPQWFCSQKYLTSLDFSNTGVLSSIPSCFWNLTSQLQHLNLSHNQIHGQLPKQLLFPSYATATVYFSSNYFSGPLPHIPFSVTLLDLSNNQISGSLSQPLCYEMNETMETVLKFLNLRENSLSGEIPDCWMKWKHLQVIILASNRLTGRIPSSMGTLYYLWSLHLRQNSLSGEITPSLRNCTRLRTLDFEDNELDGNIPAWLGHNLLSVRILSLGSNKFQGHIPNEICALSSLHILDLSHNNISGGLPRCFSNFSSMAFVKDGDLGTQIWYVATDFLRMSSFSGYHLHYINSLPNIVEYALVVMKGHLREYNTILNLVRIIDLSGNNLSGEIPEEMSSLQELQSLNLSHNCLTGRIPENIGDMKSLESLDLSVNKLSSSIPPSMSRLSFLNHLNLSNNHLIGRIPSSTQLQSLDASSYAGNQLSGPPLTNNCSANDVVPSSGNGREKKGDADTLHWVISILLGFIVGFWGVLIPLIVNRGWRQKYYNFLDNIWSKVSVIVSKCF